MSPDQASLDPHPPTHEDVAPDEAARERGDDPASTLGAWPTGAPDATDPSPGFQPDPDLAKRLAGEYGALAKHHRPRREDVLPYELIRAFVPGDRGARPTWPPTACWESPDILIIDASYTGPFDPALLVGSPISGRSYRVFIRVFNLGRVPGVGTHVQAWFVEPGFFSGQPGYDPQPIGGAFVDLDDRTRPGSHAVVELDRPWVIPATVSGHNCLMASVDCIADPWSRSFDANHDRHVGQRNLEIAVGAQTITPLLGLLGARVPDGGALEVLHAGAAVGPLLASLTGGRLTDANGASLPVLAADAARLNHGVPSDVGRHLLTALREGTRAMVVPSDVLAAAVQPQDARTPIGRREAASGRSRRHAEAKANPFGPDGTAVRALRGLDTAAAERLALVGGPDALAELLPGAFRRMLDVADLDATSIAAALGGAKGAAHLLRFVATDAAGELIGGYSIVLA